MGALQERLARWRNPFEPNPALRPERLEQTCSAVRRDLGEATPREPDAYSLQETFQVLAAARDPAALREVSARHLRQAPWVIFDPRERGTPPLAERPVFLENYLARLRDLGATSAILVLAQEFLQFYPRTKPYFSVLLKSLQQLLPLAETVRGRRFREQIRVFGLLDEDGPKRFGKRLLEAVEVPDELLVQAGLTGRLANKGFVEWAYAELLGIVQARLTAKSLTDQHLARVLNFSMHPLAEGGGLRFSGPIQRVRLAEVLLLPFYEGDADATYKPHIRDYILKHYKDPRLDRKNWQGVSKDAQVVMFRWLVENTLEDFFRLLDYSAHHNPSADRQWPFRHAFWSAYLKEDCISDAWVVLGERIALDAGRYMSELSGTYGRLIRGGGAMPTHAVLLMRVGDLVITEWSHTGKCRIWHADNPAAPKFYRLRYRRREVVNDADLEKAHMGAQTGNWQAALADYIRTHTGIGMSHRQYMPAL